MAQLLFFTLIYERFFEHPVQQFVDLCSLTNVSVFLLENYQFGYYIHGRSVHGRADTGLREMHENFLREQVTIASCIFLFNGNVAFQFGSIFQYLVFIVELV